jgi:hypothetical protein
MPTVNYREVLMRSEGAKGKLCKRDKQGEYDQDGRWSCLSCVDGCWLGERV